MTFVARTTKRRVDVTGTDRISYLEDVTSQALDAVSAGNVRGALYLDPHGAPLAMFDVAVLADRVALIAPDEDVATTLVEVLGGRTFLLDASFELTDDQVLSLRGEDVEEVASAANLGARPGTVRPAGDAFVIGREGGVDVVGPKGLLDDLTAAVVDAGAREGDLADLEAWRVAAGEPAWGSEVAAPHLPEEVGLLPTHVHLGKGCYPGQEAVARMWMLGKPRRRLAVVAAEDAPLPLGWQAGSGRKAVTVTSAVPAERASMVGDGRRHLALAFVPGDAEDGARFTGDDGRDVEVVRLVGADPVPPGHDPAVTQRRNKPRD
jgi:tRNA-modifying protein YgfZ